MLPVASRPIYALLVVGLVAAVPPSTSWTHAAEPLPWQTDYAVAVERARAAHQHMFVMVTGDACVACRGLEAGPLTNPTVREGLADMVWVRVRDDDVIASRLGAKEVPTLMFVNPFTSAVLHRVVGDKDAEGLSREIVHARRAIGVALTPALEQVATRMFSFDDDLAEKLLEAGDAAALSALLMPAAADDSRQTNYLLAHVTSPAGLVPDDVRFLVGSDCLIGSDHSADVPDPALVAGRPPDLAGSCVEYGIPASGLVLVPCDRTANGATSVRITAPGCRLVSDTIRFDGRPPDNAVQTRGYTLRPLTDVDVATLSGRVLDPLGRPTTAIVRIDDWYDTAGESAASAVPAVVRTDAEGRFTFPRVSPGTWLVRAEFPGGEREEFVSLEPGDRATCDITLRAVSTVGLRWVLQSHELSQDLVGPGARAGEAHVSIASSRIALARGMRIRTEDCGDLMLAQTPLNDETLDDDTKRALDGLPAGTPVWFPVDAAYTADFQTISGLHRERRPFAEITSVREGGPLPDQEWVIMGPLLPRALAASRERGGFFQFPRGEPVRVGDVFTVRCASSNCFAKIEVFDVTIVSPASR